MTAATGLPPIRTVITRPRRGHGWHATIHISGRHPTTATITTFTHRGAQRWAHREALRWQHRLTKTDLTPNL